MAGLDTSIALGIKPVDFGDPNEGRMNALRAQMMQMQMQQGQFNMMKAQRDMQYQDQQRAAAAAAVARDKAAEKEAINAFLKTAQPGYTINPDLTSKFAAGAASDIGFLGDTSQYPDLQGQRVAPTAPDMNATIQQLRDRGRFDAAKKMMGQNQAFNVNETSNVELGSKRTKAEADKIDGAMKAIAYHVTQIPAVTPENYAAWRESVVKAIPGYDSVLAKEAPADPNQFSQMMGQYQQLGTKVVADYYTSVTQGQNTKIVGIRPGSREAYTVAGSEGTIRPQPTSDVGKLIEERNNLDKNSPTYAQDLEIYNDRIEKATNIKGGGNELPPLKPADKFKIEQGLSKSYTAATTFLDTLENAHDALQNVQGSNLAGTTGVSAYIPSIPGGAAATSENRMETLKGRVTAMGKAAVASTGAIGPIATQEWKILTNMVAALDPGKGEKAYREALDDVEAQIQTSKNRIRDAYEKAHVDTLKRPEFQQYGALPEPRERGGVMPGSNPNAQKPAISRVKPNPPASGLRVPAGGAGAAPTNTKGWVLHTDANGNKAYVSPDGKSFEEVK